MLCGLLVGTMIHNHKALGSFAHPSTEPCLRGSEDAQRIKALEAELDLTKKTVAELRRLSSQQAAEGRTQTHALIQHGTTKKLFVPAAVAAAPAAEAPVTIRTPKTEPIAVNSRTPNLQWCLEMRKQHSVVTDLTWGTLPAREQGAWASRGCDKTLVGYLGERTSVLQIPPDLIKAAANKKKRNAAYKPFTLSKLAVTSHQWLTTGGGSFAKTVHTLKGYGAGNGGFVQGAGKNHYQLMSYLSSIMRTADGKDITICDIGSKFGDSLRAWTTGSDSAFVHSYDVADVPGMISSVQPQGSRYKSPSTVAALYQTRVKFHKVDINKSPADMNTCLEASIMLLDVEHQVIHTVVSLDPYSC
jgi:hypothetical protein